jgi:hypothetical protein
LNKQVQIENKESDLLFLQKKRKPEQSFLNYQWKYMTPKKEVEFSFLKQKDFKSEAIKFTSSSELYFDYNIEKKNSPYRLNEIEYLFKKKINSNNENQKIDLEVNDFEIPEKNKFFKNEKIDIDQNIELSKFKIFWKDNNLFKEMDANNNGNDIIENNCGKKDEENIKKRNEVKVILNNKLVYSNSNDTYSYSNNFQKSKKIIFINAGRRRSKYRGVSKNGNQWQVLFMVNNSKSYVGTYTTEDLAARVYDIMAIKNRGNKAKTNFIYSETQIRKIFNTDIDIKSKNLKEKSYPLI